MNTPDDIPGGGWLRDLGPLQWLGLCPLLAGAATALDGLTLGFAVALALAATAAGAVLLPRDLAPALRTTAVAALAAAAAAAVQQLCAAYAFGRYQQLGLFLALVAGNAPLLARADARPADIRHALTAAARLGLGSIALLALVGLAREGIGGGTLFATGAGGDGGLQLALLPAGALIIAGCLLAVRNYFRPAEEPQPRQSSPAARRRVRVTGPLR